MATKAIRPAQIQLAQFGGIPAMVKPEVGQTFVSGQFLSINAAGNVVAVASNAVVVSYFSTGSAVDAVTGLLLPFVPAYRVTADMQFSMNLLNAGVSGAVLAQTAFGLRRALSVVNGVNSVSLTGAATPLFTIIGLPMGTSDLDEGTIGDTDTRVTVRVPDSQIL